MIEADERVLFVRHDLYTSEWEAIGMILMKGYLDFGYFPIFISYCFIHYCLYGKVEENELIDGFLKYLTADKHQIIDMALKSDSNEVFLSEVFLDILEQFNCHPLAGEAGALPETTSNGILLVVNLCVILIETSGLREFPKTLPRSRTYLQKGSKPENEAQRECLHYFKKYVKSLDKPMLKHLLEFLTASHLLIVDEIKVSFTKNDSTFARRPIAYTCGPCLELPSTYSNLCEVREEFTPILKKSTW